MLKIDKTGVSTSKRVYFLKFLPSLASVMAARPCFARSCSLLSKYLPILWKQRKEQLHAQCHVTHRIRIFDKISEHVKVAKLVDIAVPELAVIKTPNAKPLTRMTLWKHPINPGNINQISPTDTI